MDWLTGLVKYGFDRVIELYKDPTFPYFIASVMFLTAAVILVIALFKTVFEILVVIRRSRSLKRVIRDAHGDIHDARAQFTEHYYDIAGELEAVAKFPFNYLAGAERLRLAWLEFEESLLKDDVAETIRNTVRPQTFFMRALRPPNWLEFWANLAVGIGLFFTFFGLVAALTAANKGVNSGDMTEMTASLATLLAAASAKFVTSIMGVGLSIILKAFHKLFSALLRARLADLCHKLETGLLYVAPQAIAAKQLEQAEQQTVEIKKQADEIGMKFEEKLGPLNETLARAAEDQRRAIEEGIGNMFGEVANAEIRHMSEMLAALSGVMDGLGDNMATAGQAAATQIREATAELVKTKEAFSESADELAKIGPVMERWEAATVAAADNVDASLRSFAAVVAMMEDSVQTLEAANGVLREHMDASDARLQAGAESVSQANDNVSSLADRLTKAQSDIVSSWQRYEERFGEVDSSLGDAVDALSNGYQVYQESVNGRLSELDSRLGDAVSRLANFTEDMRDVIDQLDAGSRQIVLSPATGAVE